MSNPSGLPVPEEQDRHQEGFLQKRYEMGVWLINDGGSYKSPRTFNFLAQDRMANVMGYRIGRDGYKRTQHPTEKPELLTCAAACEFDPGSR